VSHQQLHLACLGVEKIIRQILQNKHLTKSLATIFGFQCGSLLYTFVTSIETEQFNKFHKPKYFLRFIEPIFRGHFDTKEKIMDLNLYGTFLRQSSRVFFIFLVISILNPYSQSLPNRISSALSFKKLTNLLQSSLMAYSQLELIKYINRL
jgi:hypothetical protein